MLCSPYSSFAEVIRDVIINASIGISPGEEAILLYFLWPLFDMFSGFAMADGGDKDKVSSTVYRGKAILSSYFVFADIAVLIILHRRPGLGAVTLSLIFVPVFVRQLRQSPLAETAAHRTRIAVLELQRRWLLVALRMNERRTKRHKLDQKHSRPEAQRPPLMMCRIRLGRGHDGSRGLLTSAVVAETGPPWPSETLLSPGGPP
ncbi:uncharacterized protein GGS25DRAFT_523511 [Hypoxylon fragiforme]|uniref:uncharacterized protein n=1 Tax=Hypoxylon fragiforme TaxID=63214 RepID=UPI0020C626C6|nr:uncharacterized protein GGS25DRAFT_523511 [Hypoxylon fragiforme]KAI2605837.1 hypothetical protein GGS25DRAFT_523511 [Hypoxylon fragiforme]